MSLIVPLPEPGLPGLMGSDASLSFSHQGLHWKISVPSEFYKRS